ncbi:hypothetical protein EMIT0P2_20657 [Pseudomonas sp. IT-P2]
MPCAVLQVVAKVCLYGFVHTFVANLRSASHIFVHVEVTLKQAARLKSQHPAMFSLSAREDRLPNRP